MKLLTHEPILTAALVEAALVCAVAFGLDLDAGQVTALTALAGAVLAIWSRQAVVSPATLADTIGEIPARAVGGIAGKLAGARADQRGSAPLAMILFVLVIIALLGGIAVSCDAMFEDEDERDDLGLVVYDHDDWGGGSDGNSGGEYEGGRGGSDYDGDGDGNRCRNFCFYGVPYPGQPQPYLSQAIPSLSASSRVL